MRKFISQATLVAFAGVFVFQSRNAHAQETVSQQDTQPAATTTDPEQNGTPAPTTIEPKQGGIPKPNPIKVQPPKSDDENAKVEEQSKIKERIERKTKTKVVKGDITGTGFGIFGGADLGLIFTAPTDEVYKSIESSQLGVAPTFKFGGSVFTRRIALDFGLGLQYAYYTGTLIALPSIDDFGDVEFIPLNKKYSNTQAAMHIEAAGRLRFKEKLQAGLLANVLFSASSGAFSSLPDVEGDNAEKYIALIGPQLVYETNFKNYISRIYGSFLISLTSTRRTAYVATIGTGLGSFLVNPVSIVKTQSETKFRTKITRETINLKAQSADVSDNVSFIFDSQMVNFKLNSAELNPKSAGFIGELGEMFARERDLWGKLLIEGHTDSRGSQAYNMKLSTMRARSVLETLEKAGVARESMEAAGLGPTRLLVNPEQNDVDYARNRRVEIRILGLKDARALRKYVDEIQAKYFGKPAEVRTVPIPKRMTPDESATPQEPVFDPGLE
jgi:outer membrane protein OmpA-like peptidoglycan-associated protein